MKYITSATILICLQVGLLASEPCNHPIFYYVGGGWCLKTIGGDFNKHDGYWYYYTDSQITKQQPVITGRNIGRSYRQVVDDKYLRVYNDDISKNDGYWYTLIRGAYIKSGRIKKFKCAYCGLLGNTAAILQSEQSTYLFHHTLEVIDNAETVSNQGDIEVKEDGQLPPEEKLKEIIQSSRTYSKPQHQPDPKNRVQPAFPRS